MSEYPDSAPHAASRAPAPPTRATALRHRLAELRGPAAPQPLDARALAALAANPGCRRRALLDGAGVDKAALADALGAPSVYGQSQFAFVRGNAFEARVASDGGADLLRLTRERLDPEAAAPVPGARPPEPGAVSVPDLAAAGPEGRTARTALALREAAAFDGWTLLLHPMLALDVAGTPAFLEPDAVVVHPGGLWSVVEIKSFPLLDGSAEPAKVGAAARQAAVYVLALADVARRLSPAPQVGDRVLLVCPRDFSNLPAAAAVDVRRQLAVTRRQLVRLTRIEEIADALPEGTVFDVERPRAQLLTSVESVPATYAPECLAACELAFHCRERAREQGSVTALGRSVRGELGALTTVDEVLSAAYGRSGAPDDPTVAALRRAAALRAEALGRTPREPHPGPVREEPRVPHEGPVPDGGPVPHEGPAPGPGPVPGEGPAPHEDLVPGEGPASGEHPALPRQGVPVGRPAPPAPDPAPAGRGEGTCR